jgi:hypothetical protein
MNEVNWNNFKAKFYGKEPRAFEHLCYLLFSREFNQRTGIFRYKNQAGIETEPININGEFIGFQSKFFEAKINQQEIKESIEKAKDKNPALNKIYFYINQEFSESSVKGRKQPQQKVEIEIFAKFKGLEIVWRVPSHIEAQLSLDENRSLSSYFFSLEKGVLDFLSDLTNHALAILKPIHSEIVFEGTHIKIDRSDTVSRLRATLEKSPLVILSGAGGVGKTALVKDFHVTVGGNIPFFVFKAAEFNVTHVNELFSKYGNFTVIDFVNEHVGASEKYVVIDSAEKLSDLENQEVFQEFLSTLLQHGWKVIFTTRYSYLDDLRFQFVEIYRLSFQVLDIEGLEYEELERMSGLYKFTLPRDPRLSELLKNPFYLNEYLQNYRTLHEVTSYSDFKNLLWDKQIARSSYRVNNTHLKRERCFLNIAKRRADTGGFVVSADDCPDDILRSLEADEIIEHDTKIGGYFVTHDIYEEWALDKFIERAFYNSVSNKSFFDSLGSSLSVRRAFRNWLSEKLFGSRDEIKHLIEESFISSEIEHFWKDEILVSVLLSDYSEAFFQVFEQILLVDKQRVLLKAVFLLRIACKEIDEEFLRLLDISRKDLSSIKTVFTKPKGKGWESTIEFLYGHRGEIDPSNVSSLIPLLEDWNRNKREGATTRMASLLALYYYEEGHAGNKFRYSSRDKSEETLIGIIFNGTSEIKEELKGIFNEVLSKREKDHRSKYYKLIQTALSSATDSFEVAKNLPEQLLSLADFFWFQHPDEDEDEDYRYSPRHLDVEDHFCISTSHREYYPASAFQTPIYQLLRFAPEPTIEFVLSFTNRAVECYANSEFRNEVREVEVVVNDNETVKQYLSGRLWGAYRGGQTSTYLLESIHMALERWLLEYAKTAPQAELEGLCIHLIRNSNSASITAVVESVVLAQPVKLFGVAKVLFQTKEFFFISTSRMLLDQSARSHYSIGFGSYENELYQNERMKTCDDPHRKLSLELLATNYQFFRLGEETEEQIRERQEVIWSILDRYYEKLPGKAEETEADKTWRLYLARMDRRKMKPEVEERDGEALLIFNPEIEPELRQFSEDSLKSGSEAMRYTSLYLWSHSKFKREGVTYERDRKYEDNVQLVISETKEILARSGAGEENHLSALNASIPAFTCAILLRDYFEKLSDEEKDLCRQVITDFASMPFALKGHQHHVFDGIEPAILTLPLLIKHFPQHKDDTKLLLLLLLLEDYREDVSGFAANAVLNQLWGMAYNDAQSILLGFLLLKPKYDALRSEMRKAHYKEFQFGELPEGTVLGRFVEQHKQELEDVVSGRITYENLENIESLNLEVLCTAFELIPLKTKDVIHRRFVTAICPIFSANLLEDDDKVESTLKRRFFSKFAEFILSSEGEEIKTYLQPFVDNSGPSRELADLLESFISAEDRLERYSQFWTVWNLFYEKIVELAKDRSPRYYIDPILHNYLLAWRYWIDNAQEWHTIKEREKFFFKKAAQDMGHQPSVLYSLSKLLTGIGSKFIEDGIYWLSDVLRKNGHLASAELETNTVYYIENISRKYILVNRSKIKSSPRLKGEVIAILNFLVQRGSAIGYLLREDVL